MLKKIISGGQTGKEFADKHKRPSLHIDLNQQVEYEAAVHIHDWIAQKYGVTPSTISRIICNKAWKAS